MQYTILLVKLLDVAVGTNGDQQKNEMDKMLGNDPLESVQVHVEPKEETLFDSSYFVDRHDGWNNVYHSTSTPYVQFIGFVGSTDECIQICVQNSGFDHGADSSNTNRCESYSYFLSNHQCFGRFGSDYGLLWTPIQQKDVNSGRIIYRCSSDRDCQFNGECNLMTGNCSCFKAWSGFHCQSLNLQPATKGILHFVFMS